MVTIVKGTMSRQVTKGAFKALFEPNGWEIADSNEETILTEEITEEEEKDGESTDLPPLGGQEDDSEDEDEDIDEEEDEDIEIPLSEMTVRGLQAYAEENDIDVSKAKNKAHLIQIIESALEEE